MAQVAKLQGGGKRFLRGLAGALRAFPGAVQPTVGRLRTEEQAAQRRGRLGTAGERLGALRSAILRTAPGGGGFSLTEELKTPEERASARAFVGGGRREAEQAATVASAEELLKQGFDPAEISAITGLAGGQTSAERIAQERTKRALRVQESITERQTEKSKEALKRLEFQTESREDLQDDSQRFKLQLNLLTDKQKKENIELTASLRQQQAEKLVQLRLFGKTIPDGIRDLERLVRSANIAQELGGGGLFGRKGQINQQSFRDVINKQIQFLKERQKAGGGVAGIPSPTAPFGGTLELTDQAGIQTDSERLNQTLDQIEALLKTPQ